MCSDHVSTFKTPHHVKLTEAYEDRVNQIAQKVIDRSKHVSVRPADVVGLIDQFAAAAQISDWRLGGRARKDFVKDVVVTLKGKILWAGDPKGKSAARKALTHLAKMLVTDLEHELGSQFPDGDPHDAVERVLRSVIRADHHASESWNQRYLGNPELTVSQIRDLLTDRSQWEPLDNWLWNTLWPLLDKQFRLANQGQSTHEYMAAMWDSWHADARSDARMRGKASLDQFDQQHGHNPYR